MTPNQNQMVQKRRLSYQHVVLKSGLPKNMKLYLAVNFAMIHPSGTYSLCRLLTLLAAEVFRDGGAVTEIRPPPPLTGDLLSSLAARK